MLKDYIYTKRIPTPIGDMIACVTNKELCFLDFCDRKNFEKLFVSIQKAFNGVIVEEVPTNAHGSLMKRLEEELNEYFKGKRKEFTIPLHVIGTDFQKKVWQELLKIPYGKTISYRQEAINIGNPKSYRAVANANGRNKISIIIPCHRVIASSGDLGGYGGGIERKQFLLDLESNNLK